MVVIIYPGHFMENTPKNNDINLARNACLCCHLLVTHVQLNCLAIDKFGPLYYFINQWWCTIPIILQWYNCFQHTEATIKYNHIGSPKYSLGKSENITFSYTLFMKLPPTQLWGVLLSLHNIFGIHYSIYAIRNIVILVDIRMWLTTTKNPTWAHPIFIPD